MVNKKVYSKLQSLSEYSLFVLYDNGSSGKVEGISITIFDNGKYETIYINGFDFLSIPSFFSEKSRTCICFSLFDIVNLVKCGLSFDNNIFDVSVAYHYLYNDKKNDNLASIVNQIFKYKLNDTGNLCSLSKERSYSIFRLKEEILKRMECLGLDKPFFNIEMIFSRTILDMNLAGISIDHDNLMEVCDYDY